MGPTTSPVLRAQALEIVQNLLANAPANELARYVDNIGEEYLLEVLSIHARNQTDPELRIPVQFSYLVLLANVRRYGYCQISRWVMRKLARQS